MRYVVTPYTLLRTFTHVYRIYARFTLRLRLYVRLRLIYFTVAMRLRVAHATPHHSSVAGCTFDCISLVPFAFPFGSRYACLYATFWILHVDLRLFTRLRYCHRLRLRFCPDYTRSVTHLRLRCLWIHVYVYVALRFVRLRTFRLRVAVAGSDFTRSTVYTRVPVHVYVGYGLRPTFHSDVYVLRLHFVRLDVTFAVRLRVSDLRCRLI